MLLSYFLSPPPLLVFVALFSSFHIPFPPVPAGTTSVRTAFFAGICGPILTSLPCVRNSSFYSRSPCVPFYFVTLGSMSDFKNTPCRIRRYAPFPMGIVRPFLIHSLEGPSPLSFLSFFFLLVSKFCTQNQPPPLEWPFFYGPQVEVSNEFPLIFPSVFSNNAFSPASFESWHCFFKTVPKSPLASCGCPSQVNYSSSRAVFSIFS